MYKIIDTHSHLFVEEFSEDRAEVMLRAREAGITRILMPNIDAASVAPMLEVCAAYPDFCYPMLGLHPTEVKDGFRQVLVDMKSLLHSNGAYSTSPFIAIGEVGLDFYWDDTRKKEQIEVFSSQIEWACEMNLPLAIHSRSAFDELYSVMESFRSRNISGVFHCFSGSEDEARKLLSFDGFYLGIGGVVTYKNSTLPSVLAGVPLERLLLETDSPYLAPVPKRGKRNESSFIPYIANKLAEIYSCPVEHVAAVTTANARKLFKL